MPVLRVQNLTTQFQTRLGYLNAVDDVSFDVYPGEVVGIVGESGSGKTVTALSVCRLLPDKIAGISSGSIEFQSELYGKTDICKLTDAQMRSIRGNEIGMIFQEPMTSLNPVFTLGDQVAEVLKKHLKLSGKQALERTLSLFRDVQLPRPEKLLHSYPHQVSGGQKQRVMIAMAMACSPKLLLADEPTTALDVTVQAGILRLMNRLRQEKNTAMLFVTHDLGVIAGIADRILVMYKGKIVEQGTVWDIFSNPQHPYTKGLLACRPRLEVRLKKLPTVSDFMEETEESKGDNTFKYKSIGEALLLNAESKDEMIQRRVEVVQGRSLLKIKNLKTWFPLSKGFLKPGNEFVKAVDDVSFEVYPGETIGLVGESGCGKTTLGRSILRLEEPSSGFVFYDGHLVNHLPSRQLQKIRKEIQIIFQDPYASLNPRMTLGQAITEPIRFHNILQGEGAIRDRVYDLLHKVGLDRSYFGRFPHQMSGGQRQRACIARALAVNPRLIICDEPVSALDVSVQAQVLNLLNDLKKEFKITYIFISHDLSVIKFIADRILVMKNGKLVEMGFPDTLFERPREEYTRMLIQSIPRGDLSDIQKAALQRKLASR
ncbi:MAG: ABC transporter ATP-binding protein [Cyclobacteriaceae bacterium]|nr:ABC transporter ATP-binding protein [Cyclobacteriaceae bacterium]